MAYKRIIAPPQYATRENLTADLVGIGFLFAANSSLEEPNIEDTLVAASLEGLSRPDYRVLSLLVDWVGIHFERVNVERLTKMVSLQKDKRVKAFWAAIAKWRGQGSSLKKLQKLYNGPRLDLAVEQTPSLIKRNGEDERFFGTALRIPNLLLRHRPTDILSPHELAKTHRAYTYRVMIGPSYRADMWALLDRDGNLTPIELSRKSYGSFATALEVKRAWLLLHQEFVEKLIA